MCRDEPQDPSPGESGGEESRPPMYTSEELLKGARELWIEHGDEMYRLRLTANGRLYLTK